MANDATPANSDKAQAPSQATHPHETGTVRSGDVDLFYRRFAPPSGKAADATPVLIFHGAAYYDSADWIEVAAALAAATGREVASWDMRGFGESGWSPSKDYSFDAIVADVDALLDAFGWPRAVMVGHSRGGQLSVLYTSRVPGRVAALAIVDHCPGKGPGDPLEAGPKVGNEQAVFPTVEAALAATSRDKDAPPGSAKRARAEAMLKLVDGGYVFRRDPDFANPVPVDPSGAPLAGWAPKVVLFDNWVELANIRCPLMLVRGSASDRYTPDALDRLARDYPHIGVAVAHSGHDVANGDPDTLIRALQSFIAENG